MNNGAVEQILAEDLDVLKELPLFKRFCDTSFTSLTSASAYSTVSDFSHINPCLFPMDFISHDSSAMCMLLKRLGVKCLSRCQYFRHKFLATLNIQFRAFLDTRQSIEPFTTALLALLAEVKVND